MRKSRTKVQEESTRKIRPAISPEARDSQMISLAIDLAEKQLLEGTASSQVITHYLKLAASREKDLLELEKLQEENKLLRAKTEALESAKRSEELFEKAIVAMKDYRVLFDDEE